ncbi:MULTISPECIES: OB-fold domain-containing protein [Halolamina]|uniref:Hydroxymethylglutaryl-CoA synthase n=1 Tax=Halolamina pelagica TaxID=699431 RepID=A0A1I5NTW0_9EURY|nr:MULTISPECIES: zinc ribbon domain-containing protein [Halolamina]NHX36469.1 hydroxymethylglutaryl-CoA synthase family protein [Halolamina sp. R1-12]SFP25060.1 hydroxymethylglutaryl-CoA synthase [Halolamina pelagica]
MSDDPTSEPGVAAIGAYTPRLRVDAEAFEEAWGRFDVAGVEEKAVPEADEDALTMGVAAAGRALDAAGRDGDEIAHLAFATTTPPMAEEELTPRLASVLGAPADAATRTLTGSTRAGAQALAGALDAGPWGNSDAGDADGIGLVVAADCRRGAPDSGIEHAAGAGAAALVLAADAPGTVVDRAAHVASYPGTRFRGAGDDETTGLGVTQYDREAFTAALGGAADGLDADPSGVDAAAVQSPDGKLPYRAAGALGVDTETIAAGETVSHLGDTGAASTFLGAASAFDDGSGQVLIAAYGSGAGANLFVIDGSVPVNAAFSGATDVSYAEYLRRRGEITSGEPEGGGAYVSVPSWQRTTPQRHRLVAGRCPNCGALNFPPGGACRACGGRPDSYEQVELPGEGTVEAVTTIAQGGAPPEFVEQQSRSGPFLSAIVALDGPEGGNVSVPSQVVGDADGVEIGTRVEATTRRIYTQEGVIRYGFKMQPVDRRR